MNRYEYNELSIHVANDQTYTFGSADNNITYLKHYFGEGGQECPASKHGIRVFDDEKEIYNCIIIGFGGATDVHKNSSIVDKDQLIVCCCNTVFCLALPELNLKWKVKADWATCFQVFKLLDDYVVHGELEISRIDNEGRIKWQFGGCDIFVSSVGAEEFKLEKDHISLIDFDNRQYKINFEGKEI